MKALLVLSVTIMAKTLVVGILLCAFGGADGAPASAAASDSFTSLAQRTQHVMRRLHITAKWWLRSVGAARATTPRQYGSARFLQALPSEPDACNPQYDSQQSYAGQESFQDANADCYSSFSTCIVSGNTTNDEACNADCTASIDVLQSACDNTYCEVDGSNAQPLDSNFPPFTFRTAACLPDNCDQSQHDAQQAYYRGMLCGELWSAPDCSINLTCAYDLSSNTIWIIVGSIVGAFVLVMIVLVTWWCIVKRRLALEQAEAGTDGDVEYEDFADGYEPDTAPLAPQSEYNRGGATYVVMPRGAGSANDAILAAGEDRL